MPASATVLLRARTLLTALVGLTVVVALAACTTSEKPQDDQTTRVVTSPSVAPTPTPTADDASVAPDPPTALGGPPTPDGARDVAIYFQDLFSYMFASGDRTQWTALSHQDCVYCRSVLDDADEMVSRGEHDEGGAMSLTEIAVSETQPGAWYLVSMKASQAPSRTVNAGGQVIREYPGSEGTHVDVAVVWDGGAWAIREVTTEPGE